MAKVKINKMAEKEEVQFKKKKRKKGRVMHAGALGIRQNVRGLVFTVQCFFLNLKLGIMSLLTGKYFPRYHLGPF